MLATDDWSRRIQHRNTRAATPMSGSARLANESQPKEQAPLQLDAIWGTTVGYALAGAIYARWFRGGSFTNGGAQAAGLSKNFSMYSMASGAPRSMKMGTTRSPWRYDAGACCTLQSSRPATACDFTLRLMDGSLPMSRARLPFDSRRADPSWGSTRWVNAQERQYWQNPTTPQLPWNRTACYQSHRSSGHLGMSAKFETSVNREWWARMPL
jgi:hypothetical protein